MNICKFIFISEVLSTNTAQGNHYACMVRFILLFIHSFIHQTSDLFYYLFTVYSSNLRFILIFIHSFIHQTLDLF